ncbi:Cytochrome b5 reductase 4 [Pleurostoma richardsiae]|uniref:Cytochrome b5 reductase 4 n=1 Tax=Pleurostoma richardsiae TaxID=41990 RepID=A0AA38S6E3_9PEZI|nr:Cytochrome b5 reductase 4 [Pleurostoma richardsiae]
MWLLENDGDFLGGKELWLRPGKRYLFGRTTAEPGQYAISDKTISRKHLTIEVGNVPEGAGQDFRSRSAVTIEDLGAKVGTVVNGTQIRGQKYVVPGASNEIKMGNCPKLFRLAWHPVVFSFSFSAKDLRADPWAKLRADLEQLDIKYTDQYNSNLTTHVVSKKRNTPRTLRGLIDGKHIVMDTFIAAVAQAARTAAHDEGTDSSLLERDYDGNWPEALEYLPPKGEEASDRPVKAFAPDERRKEIFDGYTFIFYEKKQFDNLMEVVTTGKGKALLKEVVAGETGVDDFIRYVKGVAGEKGLGEFEDGSEGKGVVLVRYVPLKGDDVQWFTEFYNTIALRLDHRPIDQREFLDAILANEPGMLRRPLEVEQSQADSAPSCSQRHAADESRPMDIDEPTTVEVDRPPASQQSHAEERPTQSRARPGRRPVRSRFKGFDVNLDSDEENQQSLNSSAHDPSQQGSLFVSQARGSAEPEQAANNRRSQRKRPASPVLEDEGDILEELAPTAAAIKRRRIARGEDPIPREPTPEPEAVPDSPPAATKASQKAQKGRGRKGKKGADADDVLELAIQRREEAEARAREQNEQDGGDDPDGAGIDFADIRRLTIVEECEVRQPAESARSRDQDIAEGRWDPHWNGRRNFKKFRKQGEPVGRQLPRTIVSLEPVKAKEYGLSDDYWLEDTEKQKRKKRKEKESQASAGSQRSGGDKENERSFGRNRQVVTIDSDDGEGEHGEGDQTGGVDSMDVEIEFPRTRAGKAAEKAITRQSQRKGQTVSQSQPSSGKRPAAEPPAREKPAKRPRATRARAVADSDDSDDELKFRFGKRK